jgi:hypothetical protein
MEEHLLFWLERRGGEKDIEKAIDSAFLELNNAFGRWWAYNGKGMSINSRSTCSQYVI